MYVPIIIYFKRLECFLQLREQANLMKKVEPSFFFFKVKFDQLLGLVFVMVLQLSWFSMNIDNLNFFTTFPTFKLLGSRPQRRTWPQAVIRHRLSGLLLAECSHMASPLSEVFFPSNFNCSEGRWKWWIQIHPTWNSTRWGLLMLVEVYLGIWLEQNLLPQPIHRKR